MRDKILTVKGGGRALLIAFKEVPYPTSVTVDSPIKQDLN